MKNILKNILKLTFVCQLLLLSGCEKDLYDDAITHDKRDFKYGAVNFNQMQRKNPRAANTIKKATHDLNAAILSKSTTDLYGFEVDTTKIMCIEKEDGYKSYSLQVLQESGLHYFKNLVLTEKPDGKLEIRVVKFNLSKTFEEVKQENSLNESTTGKEVSKYSIPNNTLSFYTCIEVGYYDLVDACGGELVTPEENPDCFNPDGTRAYHIVFVIVDQSCSFSGGSEDSGSEWDGDGIPSDGTPNNSGDVGGVPSEDLFIPNLISDTEAQAPGSLALGWAIRYFEDNLDEFALPVYQAHPELRDYLAANNCDYESKQFVLEMINVFLGEDFTTIQKEIVSQLIATCATYNASMTIDRTINGTIATPDAILNDLESSATTTEDLLESFELPLQTNGFVGKANIRINLLYGVRVALNFTTLPNGQYTLTKENVSSDLYGVSAFTEWTQLSSQTIVNNDFNGKIKVTIHGKLTQKYTIPGFDGISINQYIRIILIIDKDTGEIISTERYFE